MGEHRKLKDIKYMEGFLINMNVKNAFLYLKHLRLLQKHIQQQNLNCRFSMGYLNTKTNNGTSEYMSNVRAKENTVERSEPEVLELDTEDIGAFDPEWIKLRDRIMARMGKGEVPRYAGI